MATILYVEDHPPARLLMQAIIGELTTHQLLVADSGAAAAEITKQHLPDLYILDLDLPDTDGVALAGVLTQIHAAPVIVVSAYAEAIQAERLTTIAHFYMAKPLNPEHVAEIIQRALA